MIYQVTRQCPMGMRNETIGMVSSIDEAAAIARADEVVDRKKNVNSYSLTTWHVHAWEMGTAEPAQSWTIFCRELEKMGREQGSGSWGSWVSDL